MSPLTSVHMTFSNMKRLSSLFLFSNEILQVIAQYGHNKGIIFMYCATVEQ